MKKEIVVLAVSLFISGRLQQPQPPDTASIYEDRNRLYMELQG